MREPGLTRRRLLKATGAATIATSVGPTIWVRRAQAKSDTLRIGQWPHVVPAFDDWFDKKLTREWGEKNGVKVVVDHIPVNDLRARAAAEVSAQKGHDLFGFLDPPAAYEGQVLPMNDVVTECEKRFGKLVNLAHRATYNPRSRNYFAFSDNWVPDPLHYRKDWWDDVGVKPDTWEKIREGAKKIRNKHGAPAGFGLAQELDTNMMVRALLWSYGAAEQDEAGNVTINSKATVEAIKLMTALFKESETAEVFTWDPSSNNRFFVSGKGHIIQNAISAIRTLEKQNPELAKKAGLALPAAGPSGKRMASEHLLHCYVVWQFAENPEMAKKFIVDLIGSYNDAFLASEFYNFPSFSKSVSDIKGKLAGDKVNPEEYAILGDFENDGKL